MANKTFTYQVHLDTAQFKSQSGDMRRVVEAAFAPVNVSPFANIVKEIDQIKKNLQSLSKLDLSTSFTQFSAQLRQAQSEAKALESVLKSLSSAKGFQLPDVGPQIDQIRRQLESINQIDVTKPFAEIRAQISRLQSTPINLVANLDTKTVTAQAAEIRQALQSAFSGIDRAGAPANSIINSLQLIKSNLDMIGKTDISRIFLDLNSQITQALNGLTAVESTIQNAFVVKGNPLTQSITPQIDAIKQQLESINQVDVTSSIDDIKAQLTELKQVLAGISLSSRFRTPPKFEDRINTLKKNLESLNNIVITIPNPVGNLKEWVIEARKEVAGLKTDLSNIQPKSSKGKKNAADDVVGASALKAELESIGKLDITKPLVDFRNQINQAVADLAKLKTDLPTINAASQAQASSAISKTFTGLTDLGGPTMQKQVGLQVDMSQVKQQISAISNMDVSAPLDDLHRTAITVQADIAKLQSDIGKIQQPKASMSLSDLAGGGGGDQPAAPKRGRAKKVTEDTTATQDVTTLENQVKEIKAKLEELANIIATVNSVNIGDSAAIAEKVKTAKKSLEAVTKGLNDIATVQITADLTPLLAQVKKINLDLAKIGQFSELGKLNPSGDMTQVQTKIAQIKAQLANVDNAIKGLAGTTLGADISPLVESVRAMRRNIVYISGFAENLANIGTFADFTPLNVKVEQLRQSIIKVGQVVNGLNAAVPQGDLTEVVGKIGKVKDDLNAIGRAVAEFANVVIDNNAANASANHVAKLDALKTPLANLSKTLGELGKIKIDKDVASLASQLLNVKTPLSNLAQAINGLAGIQIASDPTGLANSLEQAKLQLTTIRQALQELSGFKVDNNIGQLSGEVEKLRAPLAQIASAISGFSTISIPTDTTAISSIASALKTIKKPLTDLGSSVSGLTGIVIQGDLSTLSSQVTQSKAGLAELGKALSTLASLSQTVDSTALGTLINTFNTAKEPLKNLSKLISELSKVTVEGDVTALATSLSTAKSPLASLGKSITALGAIQFNGDISSLLTSLGQAKSSLSSIGAAVSELSKITVTADTTQVSAQIEQIRTPLAEIGQAISQIATINIAGDPNAATELATKIKNLKKPLTDIGAAISSLSGITITGELTPLAVQINSAKNELSEIGKAITALASVTFTVDPTSITNLSTSFTAVKDPIKNLGKLISDLSKVVVEGDISKLAADLSAAKAPLATLSKAIGSLSSITFTGDPSDLISKIGQARQSLTSISQAITELSKVTITGDTTGLSAQIELIRTPLIEIGQIVSQVSSVTIAGDPAMVTDLANKVKNLRKPLGDIGAALNSLSGVVVTGDLSPLILQISQAKANMVSLNTAISDLINTVKPVGVEQISALATQYAQVKKPIQDINKTITDLATIVITGDLSNLSQSVVQARVELASLASGLDTLAGLTAPQSIATVPTLFAPIKKPLADLGKLLPELSAIYITGDVANVSAQITQARVELTNLSSALTTLASTPSPSDAGTLTQLIEKFNQAKKPIQDLGKLVATLSTSSVNGNLEGLASQLSSVKGPLAEISSALNAINSIVPPGQSSVIGQLVNQLSGAGKGSVGVGQVASQLNTLQSSAQQAKDILAGIPQLDLTKPVDELLNDVKLLEGEIRKLDAAIQDTFVKGGGGIGGNDRSNALLDDYYKKLAQAQGDEVARIAKAKGVVPNMGAINSEFADDKIPAQEFEVNAKRNTVDEKRKLSLQEQLNNLNNEEQIIARQIAITQVEKTVNDREIASTQQELQALTAAQGNNSQREFLSNMLVSYQEESARLNQQEAQQVAELTRKKQEILALNKKAAPKETVEKVSQPTESPSKVTVSITDKNTENAAKLVAALEQAAKAMESIATWSDKELANQRTSIDVERQKAQLRREEARLTEAEVQKERTDSEQQRIQLQLKSGINQAESDRQALVASRLEFEKQVTAEVKRQVELYQNVKFTNRSGAQTVQAANTQVAQPVSDANFQSVPEGIYANTNNIVTAIQAMTTNATQAATASATAIAGVLSTTQQQIAQAVTASPVPQALNQLTTSMQQQIQNQSAAINQYQGVAQSLQQIMAQKENLDKASSGTLLAGRLQSQMDFGNIRLVQGGELTDQINKLRGSYQDLTSLTKGAKEEMRAELNQMSTNAQVSYAKQAVILDQYSSNLRSAYQEDSNEIKRQIDARKTLLSQQTIPGDRLNTADEIGVYQQRLSSLTDMFNKEQEAVRRQKEALKVEFDDLNNEVKLKMSALSAPPKSEPNALAGAQNNLAQIQQQQQQQLSQIRAQEVSDLRKSTEAQKVELEKRANQIRQSISAESGLTKRALDEKRNTVQQELNILQRANQQRVNELQQEAQALRRARTDQLSPLKQQITALKQAAESQTGVERETTEKTIAEITRRVEATRQLYAQQIGAVNQSTSALRQAYQAQIAPLQSQMATLQNTAPTTSPFEKLLTAGKGFASAYATVMGSQQIIRSAVAMAEYDTKLRRARVANIELAGSSQKAAEAVGAIRNAAGGTIDRLTAMGIANQAMALGLASSGAEFERLTIAARGVALVSPVIHDVQTAITELALASANMSYRRLDQLGLSVTEVKDRMEQLKATNGQLTDNQLFYMAAVDQLNKKFGELVTSSEAGATGLERLSVAWNDLATGEGVIGRFVDEVAAKVADMLDLGDITLGNTNDTAKISKIFDEIIDKKKEFEKPPADEGWSDWVTRTFVGGMYQSAGLDPAAAVDLDNLELAQKLFEDIKTQASASPDGQTFLDQANSVITDIIVNGRVTDEGLQKLRNTLTGLQGLDEITALSGQNTAEVFQTGAEKAKLFAEELARLDDASNRFNTAGLTQYADEIQNLKTKQMEDGSLSDDDAKRLSDLIAASARSGEVLTFTSEMTRILGSEYANTNKQAIALRDSVLALNAGLSSGSITKFEYDAAFAQAQSQLQILADTRARDFANLLNQIDAGLTALLNKDGNSKFVNDQIEQLRKYKSELLTTGMLDEKDAAGATFASRTAQGQGFQPDTGDITTQQNLAQVNEAYASLIARQYELQAARESGIITEQMYAQAIASVNREMQNIEINTTSDTINSANELSTAILNLDAVSAGGLSGFNDLANQAATLQEQMYATGFATAEQVAQAEYYAQISSIAASETGFYAQAVGALGEQFFATNPAAATLLQQIIELQAAHATGAVSSEIFAGKLSVLTGELVTVGSQAGLTAAQIQSAFGNAMAMVAGLKAQFGGTMGFRVGAMQGAGLVAADRRNENERVRQEQIKSAKAAGKSIEQAAKASEKIWEDAAKKFEDTLKKIPGLFKTTDVTEQDMKAAKAGAYVDKVDEYIRRLRDEVTNGKDWQGVSIEDARAGLARAGLDSGGTKEAVLAKFEEAWNNQSLWAAAENIDAFVNKEAVTFQKGLEEKIELGKKNLLAYFGQYIETETGSYVIEPGTEEDVRKKADEAAAEAMKGGGGGGGASAGTVEAVKATFADTTWMNGALQVTVEQAKAALAKIGEDIAGKTEDEILKLFDQKVATGEIFAVTENTNLVDQSVIQQQQEAEQRARQGQENLQNAIYGKANATIEQFNGWVDQWTSGQAQQGPAQGPAVNPATIPGATNVTTNGNITTGDVELNATFKAPEAPIEVDATIKGLTVPPESLQALKDSIGTLIIPVSILANTGETVAAAIGTALQSEQGKLKGQGAAIAQMLGEGIGSYDFTTRDGNGNAISTIGDDLVKKINDQISAKQNMFYASGILIATSIQGGISGFNYSSVDEQGNVTTLADDMIATITKQLSEKTDTFKSNGGTVAGTIAAGFIEYDYAANKQDMGQAVFDAIGGQLQARMDQFKGQGSGIAQIMSQSFISSLSPKQEQQGQEQQNQGIADGSGSLFSMEFINQQNQKLSADMVENLRTQFSAASITETLMAMGDGIASFIGFGMEDHPFGGIADGVVADLQTAFGTEETYSRLFEIGGSAMDAILAGAADRMKRSPIGDIIVNGIAQKVTETVTEGLK